jgi:hypothetical protein
MSCTFVRTHLTVLLAGLTSLCSLAAQEQLAPVYVSPVFMSDTTESPGSPAMETISDVCVSSFSDELQAPHAPKPDPLVDAPTPLSVDIPVGTLSVEAKEMVCATDCCDSNYCCEGSGCGCGGGCLGNDTRCQMHQHYPYYPAMHGYYYFRPYHPRHVREQQGVAALWGEDPRVPYANAVFQRVYAQYQEER